MTKRQRKRKAFLTSLTALVLSVAMLAGTTFSWFTDSAKNTGNRIVTGILDVKLLKHDGAAYVDISDGEGDIFKRKQIACMTVLKADLGEWQGSMGDAYNQEVWCVACGGWIVAGKNDPRIDHSKIKPVKPQN